MLISQCIFHIQYQNKLISSKMLTDKQNSLVQKVVRENGFENFTVSLEAGSKKGDNYLGNILLVNIKENDGSRKDSLVLKCALEDEHVRAQMPIEACYAREAFMYDTVLPAFQELQEKYHVPHPFEASAKIYGYSVEAGKEWLLLENIRNRGFGMMNRQVRMDGELVSAVLREFAKLHSLSFVMKHFEPQKFEKLSENLHDGFKDKTDVKANWYNTLKQNFYKAFEAVADDKPATEWLEQTQNSIMETFQEFSKEKYKLVIIHGDSWCNNIMFSFQDKTNPSKPTNICFLDWQVTKISTPVSDLVYFMFLSGSKEVLDNHPKYLKEYYAVLKENLDALQIDIEKEFPWNVFMEHWAKYAKLGLFLVLGIFDTLIKDEKDAQTFTDMAEGGKDIIKTIMKPSLKNEQTQNRLRDVILMLVKYNYS